MKKVLWIACMAMMAVFTACEGPEGPPGLDGIDGKDGKDGVGSDWVTVPFEVKKGDWKLKPDGAKPGDRGSYWSYLFENVPELTDEAYDSALILVYYEFTDDNGDKVMTHLPYICYDANGTYTYSFDVSPGAISFRMQVDGFATDRVAPPLEARKFYLTIIYP